MIAAFPVVGGRRSFSSGYKVDVDGPSYAGGGGADEKRGGVLGGVGRECWCCEMVSLVDG
jgi:hypothetical protein